MFYVLQKSAQETVMWTAYFLCTLLKSFISFISKQQSPVIQARPDLQH